MNWHLHIYRLSYIFYKLHNQSLENICHSLVSFLEGFVLVVLRHSILFELPTHNLNPKRAAKTHWVHSHIYRLNYIFYKLHNQSLIHNRAVLRILHIHIHFHLTHNLSRIQLKSIYKLCSPHLQFLAVYIVKYNRHLGIERASSFLNTRTCSVLLVRSYIHTHLNHLVNGLSHHHKFYFLVCMIQESKCFQVDLAGLAVAGLAVSVLAMMVHYQKHNCIQGFDDSRLIYVPVRPDKPGHSH